MMNTTQAPLRSFRYNMMLLSLITALVTVFALMFYSANDAHAQTPLSEDGRGMFSDIYEPSAVFQLYDGRVLVVEDEENRAMNILSIAKDGSLVENEAANLQLTHGFHNKLDDLEGLAADTKGFVYATTSHSSQKNGKRKANREQLLRFRIKGNDVRDISSITSLRDDLASSKSVHDAIKARTQKSPDFDELNIEGLAFDYKNNQLMLGLRAPMAGDKTIIVPITNPDAVFDDHAAPKFGSPLFLDLQGGGIRSLHFDSILDEFIIANEIKNDKGKDYSKIWTWSGKRYDKPVPLSLPELSDLKNIEGIDSVTVNGKPKLLFTADEGVEKKNKPAKYRFVDYERLSN